jgi:hypothetical protein
MESKFLFVEEQQFNRKFFIAIPIVFFLICFYGIFQQKILDIPFGNNPVSSTTLFVISLIPIGIIYMMQKTYMITKVYTDGISVRIKPFQLKPVFFSFEEVEKMYSREYKPIREYGGWGIRFGKNGKAYNMGGNMGFQLILSNGKKVLIGSRRPFEIEKIIQKYSEYSNKIGK